MKRLALMALALMVVGCAKITLTTQCPSNSTGVGFALAGSTVGNTALSLLSSAASSGLLAARTAAVPQGSSASLTYNYFAVFGADSGSLTCTQPMQQTVVVTSPPATVVSPK